MSAIPPILNPTTGVPQDILSNYAFDKLSSIEGTTNTSADE
jgi:hypothetical protein